MALRAARLLRIDTHPRPINTDADMIHTAAAGVVTFNGNIARIARRALERCNGRLHRVGPHGNTPDGAVVKRGIACIAAARFLRQHNTRGTMQRTAHHKQEHQQNERGEGSADGRHSPFSHLASLLSFSVRR